MDLFLEDLTTKTAMIFALTHACKVADLAALADPFVLTMLVLLLHTYQSSNRSQPSLFSCEELCSLLKRKQFPDHVIAKFKGTNIFVYFFIVHIYQAIYLLLCSKHNLAIAAYRNHK